MPHGIERGSYAQVIAANPKDNLLRVRKSTGERIIYDPSRLRGVVSASREIEREFAVGDRLQWTAPNREFGVANRDLGTVQRIGQVGTTIALRMFPFRVLPTTLRCSQMTPRHSAANMSRDVSKASAIDFGKSKNPVASVGFEEAATLKKTPTPGLGLSLSL